MKAWSSYGELSILRRKRRRSEWWLKLRLAFVRSSTTQLDRYPIRDPIRLGNWPSSAAVDVIVFDDIGDLWTDMAQPQALKVPVGNTPGVKRVQIHLT
jgi:hypothetical protein